MASDATGLRDYKGAAVAATLSTGISNAATTFSISPTTNWPTGSNGSFTIVIDQGTSSEEAMLCSAQSAGVLTVTTRGYDGTTATAHNLGAPVLHVPVALDFAEANQIANTHSQTSKTTPVGADEMPLFDSAATFGLKKLTMTNLAAFLASLTQTLTNKDLTDSTNKFNWPSVAGKNAIINGGMDIWQRGTSFAIANGTPQYTADRWTCYFNGTGTITQETSVIPSNSKYAIRLTATATSIDNRIFQIIETNNVLPYAGKAITISLQMAGTVGVAAGVTLTYSTSVDDSLYNILTSITLTTVTAPTLSNSLQTYVFTGTIPSTAKTLRVGIGTNGVVNTNYLVVANAQLELGSTATTFSRSGGSIGGELALCQRYYWRQNANAEAAFVIFGQGSATSTTVAYCQTPFPVQMRTKPTAIDFPTVATYFQALDAAAGGATLTALVFDSAQTTSQQGFLTATVAAGLTQFRPYVIRGNNSTGAYLGWTAEL